MVRPVAPDGPPGPAPPGGLVGRVADLDLAVRSVHHRGQVLITGEAGIGKTSLLHAAATELDSDGFRCFVATATAGLTEHPLASLGHLLGDIAGGAPHDLERRAVEALCRLAPGSSGVLVLDDVQLLDPWSLHAIVSARATDGPRLLVAARSTGPLSDAVATIGRTPGTRIELQRLSTSETAELARIELGAPLDTVSAVRIHDATDGLPLAVAELIRYAKRSGALTLRAGLWRWTSDAQIDQRLAELLGLRVESLTCAAREVLELLCMVDHLPIGIVDEVIPGVDLAELEGQRLVRLAARSGWVAPAHPLLRDACLTRLEPLRRRALLERLVRTLANRDDHDPELERRRVITSVEIGEPVEHEALVTTVAWGSAHGLWALMGPVMARAWEEYPDAVTGLAYGEALYWTGRMEEAAQVLDTAERLCRSDSERVELAVARARTLNVGLDRWDDAVDAREQMWVSITDPALRLDVMAAEAYELVHRGEAAAVIDLLQQVPETPLDHDGFRAARYRLTQATVGAFGVAGRTEDMHAEYRVHLDDRDDVGATHPLASTAADVWWTVTGLIAGRRDMVNETLTERSRTSITVDDGITRPIWALPVAVDHWLAGRLDLAELSAREALGITGDVRTISRLARHVLARVLELRGRHAEALELCAEPEPDDFFALVRHWGTGIRENCRHATTGGIIGADERRAAVERVLEVADILHRQAQVMAAAYVCHDTLRLGRPTVVDADALDRLQVFAAECDAPTVQAMASHARGVVDRDPAALLEVATRVADTGDGTLAMLVLRDALPLAMDRRDHDLVAELENVRDGLTPSGWSRPPAPTPTPDDLGLSTRELEVARAAAAGASDREIAEALVVSVRTVHAHLRSVYRKLDVHRRDELSHVSVLRDQG